ncbi:hypothetical protein HPP92_006638 [Vanilla planifolia]|uniref:Bet v I/Major latex protein domain-containing protein n=1 Tax=Vanilla planifolia TaxID=51239 RepID=A0A835VAH4_VANPL|nr:hypothetical protein HPP92_006905 [Vanilla planifolia]KAG0489775.1 hypothetical protein HPP92_006638 [Vanilla planifolia]
MVSGSFSKETPLSVPIDRLWKARILDAHNLLPKIFPAFISSVEIIEGDGGIGTVGKVNLTEVVGGYDFVKSKIEELDNEKHIVKESVVEGGLIGTKLNSYTLEHRFEEGGEGKTVERLTVEYESLDETPLSPEEQSQIAGRLSGVTKAVEGYLLANPTAYV